VNGAHDLDEAEVFAHPTALRFATNFELRRVVGVQSAALSRVRTVGAHTGTAASDPIKKPKPQYRGASPANLPQNAP
jgi:hypothetical protein